jgi:hypothetical protein
MCFSCENQPHMVFLDVQLPVHLSMAINIYIQKQNWLEVQESEAAYLLLKPRYLKCGQKRSEITWKINTIFT